MTTRLRQPPRRPGRADRRRATWERLEAERDFLAGLVDLFRHDPERCRAAARGVPGAALTIDHGAALLAAVVATLEVGPGPTFSDLTTMIRRQADAPDETVALAAEVAGMIRKEREGTYSAGVERHRQAILEAHQERIVADAVSDLQAIREDGGSIAEIIAKADAVKLAATAEAGAVADDRTSAMSVADRWARETEEKLIPTGLKMIDGRFGGGLSTGITAICAMPGNGKSALAGVMMLGALLADPSLRAIWFRGEMTEGLLWSRFLATWSSIRSPAIPSVTRKEASRRSPAARKVNADLAQTVGDRLNLVDAPLSADRIAEAIERHRPGLIVVDYLQRCTAPGFPDKRSELDHVLSVIDEKATKHGIAAIVVSSMAKGASAGNEIGGLTKESNRLDFDAHTYLALWGDKKDRDQDPRPMRLEIAKGRTGGEGAVDVWFTGSGQFFTPQAEEHSGGRAEPYAEFATFNVEAIA